MFLFRCFSSKQSRRTDDEAVDPRLKPNNSDGNSTQPYIDDEDDSSRFMSSVQDDPEFRNLYGSNSAPPSVAEATGTGENSSLSGYTTDNSSLPSNADPMLYAYSNNTMLTGRISSSGHNDDDEEEDTKFFSRLYNSDEPPEDRYTIVLPAGKAGMVLNSPEDGWGGPTIHLVKPTCPVVDQVEVGDRLVSVDGQNCNYMSALDASRILGEKANNPQRTLVLARRSLRQQ